MLDSERCQGAPGLSLVCQLVSSLGVREPDEAEPQLFCHLTVVAGVHPGRSTDQGLVAEQQATGDAA